MEVAWHMETFLVDFRQHLQLAFSQLFVSEGRFGVGGLKILDRRVT